jgi:hypothetical protein
VQDGQQAAQPVVDLRLAEAEEFAQDDLQGIGLEVDQGEQQLLLRLLQGSDTAAAGAPAAGSAVHGPVGGGAAVMGASEGRQQELKFQGRQAGE